MHAEAEITVLIVDDHEIVRLGLKTALNRTKSLSVIGEAADGITAVEEAVQNKPNVVLMDIGLPGLDGIEATREIKRKCPNTRILMLTSHEQDQEVFASLIAGADGFCMKESSSNKIINAILAIAQGAGWLDQDIASRVFARRRVPRRSLDNLTDRELEVMRLIVQGNGNRELAEALGIGIETAKTHIRNIMHKLNVSSRTHLAIEAVRQGLL